METITVVRPWDWDYYVARGKLNVPNLVFMLFD